MIKHKARFCSWLPALFDGEFDWDFLLPAWKGTKIEPMDFDAVVERNGHVLIYETKIVGKDIALGQQITLTDQWEKGATILQIAGKAPSDIVAMAVYAEGKYQSGEKVGSKELTPCDAYDVVYRSRCWFCWASNLPVPSREQWDNELWVWDYGSK